MEVTRRILGNGIKGYVAKVKRRRMAGNRIHRTAKESSLDRFKKKMLGKGNWYRGKKKVNKGEERNQGSHGKTHKGAKNILHGSNDLKTRAVIFVEHGTMLLLFLCTMW